MATVFAAWGDPRTGRHGVWRDLCARDHTPQLRGLVLHLSTQLLVPRV